MIASCQLFYMTAGLNFICLTAECLYSFMGDGTMSTVYKPF